MRGALDTLRTLAENTDGFAVLNTNDLGAGVKRISDDLSSYYVLGYYSTNPARDGRFRRIDVKVAQPAISVSARRGYYAASADEPASAAAAPEVPAGVEDEMGRLTRLRPDAEMFTRAVPTAAGVDVAVELAENVIGEDRWRAGASVTVVVRTADGKDVDGAGRIDPGTRGVLVSVPVDPTQGPWQVTVTATGQGEPAQNQVAVAPVPASVVGAPVAWRATPSLRSPLRALADPRLMRTERLHVEWPLIQEPATRHARLLDRTGKPLGNELPFAAPPADRHVLSLDLPIASLPEGDFMVELTATGAAGQTERRLFAFRVVR